MDSWSPTDNLSSVASGWARVTLFATCDGEDGVVTGLLVGQSLSDARLQKKSDTERTADNGRGGKFGATASSQESALMHSQEPQVFPFRTPADDLIRWRETTSWPSRR